MASVETVEDPEDPHLHDYREIPSPRLLILRHGLSGELEVAEVQRRWWPQRDAHTGLVILFEGLALAA